MLRSLCAVMLCCALVETNAMASENPGYVNLLLRGRAEYHDGRFLAAEPLYLAALRALQPGDQTERAATLAELGDVYVNQDEVSKAERVYAESLAIYERLSSKNSVALLLSFLAGIYSLEGRDDDALRLLQRALKLSKTNPPASASLTAQVLNCLGIVYYRQGKTSKAETVFNEALQLISTLEAGFDTAQLLNNLGTVYYTMHKFQKAEDRFQQALKITETKLGLVHPDLTFTLTGLGVLYTQTGRYAEAEAQYQRALKILEPGGADFETKIARLLYALSGMYTKTGRKSEAAAALGEASSIARRNLGKQQGMAGIVEDYSTILKAQGKTTEAEELRVEAKRARVSAGLVINAHNPF